ncbi:hypothetical protein QE152_g25094 [Popillia japonica]|uniref:Uncharacterized protein n=1 Tax=Popillia japonica TaxID=7064 RepID=A0AAW1K157_POPJA
MSRSDSTPDKSGQHAPYTVDRFRNRWRENEKADCQVVNGYVRPYCTHPLFTSKLLRDEPIAPDGKKQGKERVVAGDSPNVRVKPDLHPKKSMMDLGNAQKECYSQKRVGESPKNNKEIAFKLLPNISPILLSSNTGDE